MYTQVCNGEAAKQKAGQPNKTQLNRMLDSYCTTIVATSNPAARHDIDNAVEHQKRKIEKIREREQEFGNLRATRESIGI